MINGASRFRPGDRGGAGAATSQWRSIAAKLYLLVVLVVLSLAVLIAIAVQASEQMALAGAALYNGVQAVSQANHIETLWERARGLAARAPAELDLDKQKQFHATFGESLAAIRTTLLAQRHDGAKTLIELLDKVDANVTLSEQSAEEVFRLGESFAQDQAVGILNGPFALAETQMAQLLGQLAYYQKDAAARGLTRLNDARQTMEWMIGITGALAVAAVATIGTLLARGISSRIGRLTGVMTRLAHRQLDAVIPSTGDRDEIGHMARAVEVFKQNAVETERLAADRAAEHAAKERRQAAMEQLTQDFGASVAGVMTALAASTETMVGAADIMSIAAVDAHRQASGTAERATRSSQDLTSIAGAIVQMNASVDEITRQVAMAAQVAHSASERVATNDGMMRDLANAASRIGDAVQLIDAIAGQTNLLALNATIEAARAGDAGKGFGVVAVEVKALASQTARATAEVGSHITSVRGAAQAAIAAMNDIGLIVGKMDAVTTAISAAVEQQSATAREIASNVQAVSFATNQAVQAMTQVVGAADEAGNVSNTVRNGVADIGREATALRTEIDQFLVAVRDDPSERRNQERVPGNGATVTIRRADMPVVTALLRDISPSGAAIDGQWGLTPGQEIALELPDGGSVRGRVVRNGNGFVAVIFRQDRPTADLVEHAIKTLALDRKAA